MGMEIVEQEDVAMAAESEESRPSILLVGSASVGKTTILNRLRENDHGSSSSSGGVACYSWKIDTKYYTANVGIWMARITHDDETHKFQTLCGNCEALVMVFDLSNDASFDCLKKWASRMVLENFEILLCVGNKADRVPEHHAHIEYRRRLQRRGESSSDPHPEFMEYGIERTEGSALLNGEAQQDPVDEKRRNRIEWCVENGIEYIEVCALNEAFDDCLSLDGDLQGVSRIRGALSAHMWQGMVMKPAAKFTTESQMHNAQSRGREYSSDEESNFTIEYELLNASEHEYSEEESEDVATANGELVINATTDASTNGEVVPNVNGIDAHNTTNEEVGSATNATTNGEAVRNANGVEAQHTTNEEVSAAGNESRSEQERGACNEDRRMEEFEQMMQEMVGMRENLRMMPDSQRREMASQIAFRMARMFMDADDDE